MAEGHFINPSELFRGVPKKRPKMAFFWDFSRAYNGPPYREVCAAQRFLLYFSSPSPKILFFSFSTLEKSLFFRTFLQKIEKSGGGQGNWAIRPSYEARFIDENFFFFMVDEISSSKQEIKEA